MKEALTGEALGGEALGGEASGGACSVATLARVVESLVIGPGTEEMQQVHEVRDRLDALISKALGGFDQDEAWREDGSLSSTAWLAHHARMDRSAAHKEVVAARRLRALPATAAAWAEGTLSSGQVSAVVANVPSKFVALFAEMEAGLVPALAPLSVGATAKAMRSWRLHAEATDDGPEPPERPSELHLSKTLGGRAELSGHLSAADHAVVDTALARAMGGPSGPGGDEPGQGPAERRAAAMVGICRWFLENFAPVPAGPRQRPQVSVIVGLSDLARGGPGQFEDGTPASGGTVAEIACDAELHRVIMSGKSTILDYGSAVRTVSAALFAALVVRDGHCRHPGCDRPPAWCQAHHVRYASRGGPTKLANLVLACTRHHHLWHSEHWRLELSPDGTLLLISPRGLKLTSRPRPVQLEFGT